MAKRKGKSQHRLNWKQRYDNTESTQDPFAPRQKLSRRGIKIPADRVVTEQENVEAMPKVQGMVLGMFPGGAIVRADEQELICAIAKMFRAPEGSTPLAVGDNVTIALTKPELISGQTRQDKLRTDGMILQRQPRETAVSRPQPRSGKRGDPYSTEIFEKVIVANMDTLLIVAATVQPPLRHGLIDRFMIIAERGELRPLLVVNKVDLAAPDTAMLADFMALGLEICQVSAANRQGLDSLAQRLSGHRCVLAGASGVGKSTLVNTLVPGAQAATNQVRLKDERGRHTTASANVYDLPGGGMLVDTPGVRELGVHLKQAELPWYFPEFESFAPICKFRDCTHTHEPTCGVITAVDEGKIQPRRYESYLRILETIEDRQ